MELQKIFDEDIEKNAKHIEKTFAKSEVISGEWDEEGNTVYHVRVNSKSINMQDKVILQSLIRNNFKNKGE